MVFKLGETSLYTWGKQFLWSNYQYFVAWLTIITVTLPSLGCSATTSRQIYENSVVNLRFEYPDNWIVQPHERLDNIFYLESKRQLGSKGLAFITLEVNFFEDVSAIDLETELENHIQDITQSYDLKSVSIIQPISRIDHKGYEAAASMFSIPITAIPKDARIIQTGIKGTADEQVISTFMIIFSATHSIKIDFFQSANDKLNTQAKDIINSIEPANINE